MKRLFSIIGGCLGYIASLSLAVIFALYCSGRVGWFLVLTFLLAPFLSVFFTFLFKKNIKISCDFDKPICAKKDSLEMVVRIKNRLFFPTPTILLSLKEDARILSKDKQIALSVLPFCEVAFTVSFTASICGVARIGIEEVLLTDYLHLHHTRVKIPDHLSASISIVPEIAYVSAEEDYIKEAVTASMECGESEETIDSSSMIFGGFPGYDHREYQPGDPLKRMNWKLSAKRDKFLVRLDEEAATTSAMIILDSHCLLTEVDLSCVESGLYEYNSHETLLAKIMENAIETALGIARTLMDRNLSVTFCYKNKDGFVMHHLHGEDYFPPLIQELAQFTFTDKKEALRFPDAIKAGEAAIIVCTPNPFDTLDLSGLVVYSSYDQKGRSV